MTTPARTLILIAILTGSISPAVAQTTSDKVVKFCKGHLGKKVGEGECANLAEAAFQDAGARPRTRFKEFPDRGDYVWGEFVYALEIKDDAKQETKAPKKSIQPGDVIQFRDAKFEGKKLRGFDNYHATYPHHTAVVLALKKEHNVITVLEQNVGGKRLVIESTYRLTDLKAGWLRIYRPVSE